MNDGDSDARERHACEWCEKESVWEMGNKKKYWSRQNNVSVYIISSSRMWLVLSILHATLSLLDTSFPWHDAQGSLSSMQLYPCMMPDSPPRLHSSQLLHPLQYFELLPHNTFPLFSILSFFFTFILSMLPNHLSSLFAIFTTTFCPYSIICFCIQSFYPPFLLF